MIATVRPSADGSSDGSPKSQSDNKKAASFLEFDSALNSVGGFGRYQIFIGFFSQWSCLLLSGNQYMMSFGSLVPKWSCDAPGAKASDHCSFLNNCTDLEGRSLLRVDSEYYSVVQQWRLTCDMDYIPKLTISIQMLGLALGSPAGGHAADHVGRRLVVMAGLACGMASGLLCSIAPNWRVLMGLIFCQGFFCGMYYATILALTTELTGKKYRLNMVCCFHRCLTFPTAALIAYLSKDWRIYAITVNGLCIPLLGLMFGLQESPRWLIQKKKFKEAADALNNIAKWNRKPVKLDQESLQGIKLDELRSSTRYTFFTLFTRKRLAMYTVICMVSSLLSANVAGVILFNVGSLVGSPFLNVALYGLLRIWAPPVLIFMQMKSKLFGRRPMYLFSLAVDAIAFLGMVVVYSTVTSRAAWLATALALAGSCINASTFDTALILYSTELFPTVVRAIAVSTWEVAYNSGAIIAPQLLYLQRYWKELPYLTLAVLGAVTWVAAFFILPETAGRPLPDNLADFDEETEKLKREKRGKSMSDGME